MFLVRWDISPGVSIRKIIGVVTILHESQILLLYHISLSVNYDHSYSNECDGGPALKGLAQAKIIKKSVILY